MRDSTSLWCNSVRARHFCVSVDLLSMSSRQNKVDERNQTTSEAVFASALD